MKVPRSLLDACLVLAIIAPAVMAQEDSAAVQSDTTHLVAPSDDMVAREPVLTGRELIEDSFPGSWPMFGKDTRIKIGGYVKADYLYDFNGSLDRQQFLMSTIPVEGTPEFANSGYLSLFASETRFNIDVRRIEEGRPPLQVFIEGDFWPSGAAFRLRHAYIVFGNFLAGQTWTTLSVLESLVFSIDFAAGDALFGGRTTQLRYQTRVDERWKLAVALENLPFMGIENPDGLPGAPSLGLPLLAGRADFQWTTGTVSFGSSVAQLRWDGGAGGPVVDGLQWDVVIGGRQYIGEDYLGWNVSYGVGSGENIMAFAGSDANAVLSSDGQLDPMPAFSLLGGYAHKWSEQLTSNFSYAYGWLMNTPSSRDPLALKRGGIGHVNLIFSPTPEFSTGIEYMYGAQRTTDDSFGYASRVQGMVKLSF